MKLFSRSLVICAAAIAASVVQAATNGVVIRDYFFNPTNLVISPGDRVIWTNVGAQLHDSTRSGLWASGNILSNSTFGFTFTNLGYYPYVCNRHIAFGHPEQTGSVSVVAISLASILKTPTSAQFEIRGGRAGLKAVVDAADKLETWVPIATNTFSGGTNKFTENFPPEPVRRFYRARVIP